jgi:hypothetical protein
VRRRSRFVLAVVGAAVLSLSLSGGVAAQPPVMERVHEEFSEELQDFCDVEGLTVRLDGVVDFRLHQNARKRDGLAYFVQNVKSTLTVTALASEDRWVTSVENTVLNDVKVTDNGDGTLTILVLGAGNLVTYDQSGKAIARNPGRVFFQFDVYHAGTPQDPSDDEFVEDSFEIVKESTGLNDDFCEAAVPVLTG